MQIEGREGRHSRQKQDLKESRKGMVFCEVGREGRIPETGVEVVLGIMLEDLGFILKSQYTHPKQGCELPCQQGPGR